MCQKCVDVVGRYYPKLTENERGELLFNATCFPFGSAEDVERQLKELVDKTDGSMGGALAFADSQMEAAMVGR